MICLMSDTSHELCISNLNLFEICTFINFISYHRHIANLETQTQLVMRKKHFSLMKVRGWSSDVIISDKMRKLSMNGMREYDIILNIYNRKD